MAYATEISGGYYAAGYWPKRSALSIMACRFSAGALGEMAQPELRMYPDAGSTWA